MFAWPMRRARSKDTQRDDWLIDRFEFVMEAPGTLIIRPKGSTLDRAGLQQVCQRILETKGLHLSRIQFDFSMVTEFSGPWSIHFGLLIRLSRAVAPRVSVTGLRGQPASAAWVYRRSPAMRALLDEPRTNTAPESAAVRTTEERESSDGYAGTAAVGVLCRPYFGRHRGRPLRSAVPWLPTARPIRRNGPWHTALIR